jgi:Tfp pilus assembly protein PilN
MSTQRLRLEFASAATQPSRLGIAMLIAGVALVGGIAVAIAQQWAGNARQRDTLAALQARRVSAADGAKRSTPTDPGEIARVRAVRQVSRNLATPWADVLESLESAPNQSVALLSVEPSAAKRSIRITAEARSAQDMLDYLAALQRDSRLSGVVLVSHQVQARAPGTPLRFQVQAAWGAQP